MNEYYTIKKDDSLSCRLFLYIIGKCHSRTHLILRTAASSGVM